MMEYFEGRNLKELLGKVNADQIIKIYKQIKSILIYLQKQKITHRDLSLKNILVNDKLDIKITDFGITN